MPVAEPGRDAQPPEAAPPDAQTPEAEPTDAQPPEAEPPDAQTPEAEPPDLAESTAPADDADGHAAATGGDADAPRADATEKTDA
jgi:hypothetical protein